MNAVRGKKGVASGSAFDESNEEKNGRVFDNISGFCLVSKLVNVIRPWHLRIKLMEPNQLPTIAILISLCLQMSFGLKRDERLNNRFH